MQHMCVSAIGMRTFSLDCDAVNHFRPNAGAQPLETNVSLHWDHIDDEAVKTAKLLAADAVEQAGSGHPGTAISLAPAAYLLYNKVMNVDPADPRWIGRDRFILSAGHSSLTQYVQLYLAGFGLELEDIKTLHNLNQKKRWVPSPDAVLSACASVGGILLILHYEQLHPVVSKAVGFVSKIRL